MDAQEVLVNFPFISPEEAAAVMCSNVSTARRRFQRMRQNGLATYHMVGRVGHLEQRWVLTREGLLHIFHAADGVPWWLKEPGLRSLYRRMEHLRVLYRLAPTLFEGAVFNVNYFCRLATTIFAGSPPYPAPAAGPLRSGSWGR